MLSLRRAIPLMALALVPMGFAFHLHLVKASPNDGEIVTRPTSEIRLWFSQKPEVSVTTITLLRADSTAVPLGKVTTTDDSLSVKATLSAPLPEGSYLVRWRALSRDGHSVRGTYAFQQRN